MKFGTPLVSPAQPFSDGQYDLLTPNGLVIAGSQYVANIGGGTAGLNVAQNHYKAILFFIQFQNTTVNALWAAVFKPVGQRCAFSGAFGPGFNTGPPIGVALSPANSVIIGCAINPGDTIDFGIWFNGVVPANTLLWIYGLTEIPPGLQIRGDGRNYPVGSLAATNNLAVANGPINLIAAPGNGNRIMLKSIMLDNSPSTADAWLSCSVAGAAGMIPLILRGSVATNTTVWESGFLLDQNTALQMVGAGTPTADAFALYDIVPA